MKKILLFVLACIFSLSLTAFVACRGASDGNDYTLEVETEISLNIYDEERKISVKSNNPNEDVEFRCESSILTVLKDGTIIVNEAGTATVYVKCGNLEKECLITVRDTNENPVITVDGIDEDLGLAINEAFPLDYSAIIANKSISGQFTFSVEDPEILSVSDDGIITAKKEGQSDLYITCSYKKWTVDKTITVSVVSDVVVRLSENRINLTTVSGVNGFDTNKTVEFLGVFNGENKINGASIIWRTLDASVATVSDGVISAVGNGKTYVKAVYSNGGKDYAAYVLVNVQDPKLSAPTNFRVENDMFIWDAVEGASGYVLLDGYNTATTNNTSLELGELNPSENYFQDRSFMVYAISNNEKIVNSDVAQYTHNFITMSFSNRLVNIVDSFEAKVEEVHVADWEADVPIFLAKCNSTSLPGGNGMYGYCFRKVYYTEMADLHYGVNGLAGRWCINSFINPSNPADFYDSKITFWAYVEQETTIYYMALTAGDWNRVVYYQATIPANVWTQFSCTITEKDFPYITMLTASGDFYFADFRISKLSYVTKDYSNISVAEDRAAETIEAIDKLPTVSNTLEYGEALMNARNKYEALSDGAKKYVSNYSALLEKESAYGELIYDTIKSNSSVENVMAMYASYIASYQPVTLDTFTSYETKASEIENAMIALEPGEYYGLKYSDEYAEYLSVREDYYLVENTRGAVGNRIGGSVLLADNGFAGIDGVDTTANATVVEMLKHPTYGPVLSMGTNTKQQAVITFKNKAAMDLSGYDYVMFGVRNSRSLPMSVVLYDENGIVKTLKSGIGAVDYNGTYVTVKMTVQEFMDYDIGFVYDEKPSATANTWLTSFIATKLSVEEERLAETIEAIDKLSTVSNTLEYGEALMNARNKYEALSDGVKEQVSNYSELLEKESAYGELIYDVIKNNSEVKDVMAMYASYVASYQPVTLETFASYEAKAIEIENAMLALEAGEYYGLKYSDEYAEYLSVREDYCLVENAKGTVSDRIGESKLVANNGFAGINGVDTTANATVVEMLKHPTYGPVLSMGTNANSKAVITFKNKADMDLSGYDYVMFGVRNSRSLPMSVVLYDENGEIVKTLKSDIGAVDYDKTYVTVKMTVEEFMNYDIGFVYAETPSAAANTWLTSFIAAKSAEEV